MFQKVIRFTPLLILLLASTVFAQRDILERPEEDAVKQLEDELKKQNAESRARQRNAVVGETVRVLEQNNLPKKVLNVDTDSFFDPKFDYSTFSGRVTDRDETTSIVKVSTESRNIKFFRAGDPVKFRLPSKKTDMCEGFVRSIEETYFVLYVKDLGTCFDKDEYFRRGTSLVFQSPKLLERVREASIFRSSLFNRKKDYLSQLNELNHSVWNYEEEKVKIAAEYDKKILEIEKQKQMALDQHLARKNDYVTLQRELTYRLDKVEKEIDFYRVEKDEPLFDRWHKDQDFGYPVYDRPGPLKAQLDIND